MPNSPIQDYHVEKHTIYCICEDESECTVTFRQLLDYYGSSTTLFMRTERNILRRDELGYPYYEEADIHTEMTVSDWLDAGATKGDHRDTVLAALNHCAYGPLPVGGAAPVKEVLIYNQYK